MSLPLNTKAARLLVLMYNMSDGKPGVRLSRADIFNEANRLNLFRMSDVEFETYKQNELLRVAKLKAPS